MDLTNGLGGKTFAGGPLHQFSVMHLKLYSDPAFLPKGLGHSIMLFPFWGKAATHCRPPLNNCYDRFAACGGEFFRMTSLSECDLGVLPAFWSDARSDEESMRLLIQFGSIVGKAGKKTVVFNFNDFEYDIPLPDSIILRTSFTKTRRRPNEYSMPAWSEDFVREYCGGTPPVRPKQKIPTVGFCGVAREPGSGKAAHPAGRFGNLSRWSFRKSNPVDFSAHPGYRLRSEALAALCGTPSLKMNVVIRKGYFGGAFINAEPDEPTLRSYRAAFVRNMLDSDYVLCARGEGNYSYRLYETLCCGRIPIFVDSDCVLPYDFMVDWKKYCIWIGPQDRENIVARVLEFHDSLSPKEFCELQFQCRRFWEELLSPEGFFRNFYHHFDVGAASHNVRH